MVPEENRSQLSDIESAGASESKEPAALAQRGGGGEWGRVALGDQPGVHRLCTAHDVARCHVVRDPGDWAKLVPSRPASARVRERNAPISCRVAINMVYDI
jgi:hypothetical protein